MSSLGVFSTKVASRNVANIILARGAQKLGTTLFLLHASQAAAEAAVHCRPELEKEPVPKESLQVGPDSNGKVIAQVKLSDQLSALPSSSRAATLNAKWVSNSSLPPLLPLPQVQSDQIVSAFAPHPTPPHSYRDALLLGSTPPPKPPARLAGVRISSTACFRCFATDHQIRACREPVRCRRCGLSGHRQRHCAKPTNSSFTSRGHPARRATIPHSHLHPAAATPLQLHQPRPCIQCICIATKAAAPAKQPTQVARTALATKDFLSSGLSF